MNRSGTAHRTTGAGARSTGTRSTGIRTASPITRESYRQAAVGPADPCDPSGRDRVDWTRLHALETLWDPGSRDILTGLGIRPGWRCLELGAGTGSVARWLAHRCQRGNVVATEVDLRFLRGDRVPNLEIVVHDVVNGEDFPPESFDLVHTRAVLAHLPDRDRAVERAARWLAPGGWLVVEEPTLYPVDSSPHPDFRRCLNAYAHIMATRQGTDLRWSRHLPSVLDQAGLSEPGLRVTTMVVGEGGPADDYWRISLEQAEPAILHEGLLAPNDLRHAIDLLDDPSFLDLSFALVSSWARKPRPGEPHGTQ
ncbi:class I SAM-dependent methyltransferase [Catenulispora rubra]|uniref:class I SAM-dependent methyltransferase n=1 Tax=Catenulispora rubra TaxID=280293 RepID=UPI0018925CF3|nr:class I SAM-dependent methyltransferase [Catenulispora rubra]